jgi:segregation and condensation protein A
MIEFTTEKFTGPLGLLLQLIEKEEMDITKVSLAKIADEYIEYIKKQPIDPEQVADFLVVAAKLLYIKSKALLPYLSSPEEDAEVEELERQLKMYKEYLEASKGIDKLLHKKKFLFIRDYGKSGKRRNLYLFKTFSPPKGLTGERLREQFEYLLEYFRTEEQEIKEEVMEYKISIEERITFIQSALLDRVRVNFSQMLSEAKSKTEVIVNFLAVLELAKQLELTFEQGELFSEIIINKL